jgi:hypothetical protein
MRWQCEGAQQTTFGQLCMVLSLYRCKEEELLIERAGKTRAIRCWEGSASGRLPEDEIRVLNNDEESVQGRGALGRPEFTRARDWEDIIRDFEEGKISTSHSLHHVFLW